METLKFYNTVVELSDGMVVLHHKKARQLGGAVEKATIPLDQITRVETKRPNPFLNGFVEIFTADYVPDKVKVGRDHFIFVTNQQKKKMEKLLTHLGQ